MSRREGKVKKKKYIQEPVSKIQKWKNSGFGNESLRGEFNYFQRLWDFVMFLSL